MQHRDHRTVTPRFEAESWSVRQTRYVPRDNARDESLFALGNGYIGVRGTPEEGAPAGAPSVPGTYLNGFFEFEPIVHAEDAYGLARWRQTLLNVTDAARIELSLDGERVTMREERISEYLRELDLRAGTTTRTFVWTGAEGRRTRLVFTRAVSLAHRRRMALRVEVRPLDAPVRVEIAHVLDGRVENRVETGDPRVGGALKGQVLRPLAHRHDEAGRLLLRGVAPASGMELVCAADHVVTGAGAPVETRSDSEPLRASFTASATLDAEKALRLDAHVVYLDARELAPQGSDAAADATGAGPAPLGAASEGTAPGRFHPLEGAADAELDAYAADGGVDALLAHQRDDLAAFWRDADVVVEGDPLVQQSLRFSLFHLLQGAGRDGRTNIPAKALTGEGYEGHTFWDTEIYVLPVFLHARPEIARALLRYRIGLLPAARERARELHHAGALYAWRTIAGPEASAYYPAGTAQYHIDADIAHAFERWVEATGDRSLLWEGGAAVVMECARFFADLGAIGRDGAFHLHAVTGPDEYTALIDDNHYTNRMAQATLLFAARLADELAVEDPRRFGALTAELGLDPDEPARWSELAERMHLPVDPESHVTPQDTSFLGKPEWPWHEVPPERYPLLLHHHPLDIYRHQVLKQADVLLAHHLLPDGVSRSQLRRDAAYYGPRTTHDSSLSPCVHAIVAADLGDLEAAEDHFRRTARMDLDDLNGNVADGVHAAAMGGTWLALVRGFGGFRVRSGEPCFEPRLPAGWTRLRFRVAWRGRVVEVDANREATRYRLLRGEALVVRHRLEPLRLEPGGAVERPTGARLRGVVFDLDGVLTDSADLHYRAWKALADDLGIPFDREANEALRGIDRMGSLERILARGERPLEAIDDAERADLAGRKNDHYRRLIEDVTPRDLLPGIPELLAELRARGLPVALASSSRNAPAVVARLGIEDRLDAVVDPATLRAGKPDPEIFEAAAAALGLPPEDCVGIEDAAAGVSAIRGAGMAAVGVGDAAALADAHVVVRDTAALSLEVLRAAVEAARSGADGAGAAKPRAMSGATR